VTSVCVPEKNANSALPDASSVGPSTFAQPVTIGPGERTAPTAATGVCIRSYKPLDVRRDQATCNVPSLPRAVPTRSEIFSCPLVPSERHEAAALALAADASSAVMTTHALSVKRAGAPNRPIAKEHNPARSRPRQRRDVRGSSSNGVAP
jgi:hypothetical protein